MDTSQIDPLVDKDAEEEAESQAALIRSLLGEINRLRNDVCSVCKAMRAERRGEKDQANLDTRAKHRRERFMLALHGLGGKSDLRSIAEAVGASTSWAFMTSKILLEAGLIFDTGERKRKAAIYAERS